MTSMTMEFDGVRELSMEEIDAVAGGPIWVPILIGIAVAGAVGSCAAEKANDRHAIENANDVCGENGVSSVSTGGNGATITCN